MPTEGRVTSEKDDDLQGVKTGENEQKTDKATETAPEKDEQIIPEFDPDEFPRT